MSNYARYAKVEGLKQDIEYWTAELARLKETGRGYGAESDKVRVILLGRIADLKLANTN